MIDENHNGHNNRRGVNGRVNGNAGKNGMTLSEFEELCANLKAQQVIFILIYLHTYIGICEVHLPKVQVMHIEWGNKHLTIGICVSSFCTFIYLAFYYH